MDRQTDIKIWDEVKIQPELDGKILMFLYRYGRRIYLSKGNKLWRKIRLLVIGGLKWWVVNHSLNCLVPVACNIGAGTIIDHPYGIIIGPKVVIGKNCRLRHQVTIGIKGGGNHIPPTIGDRVDIGAGAKIIGPVTIGDDTKIGANAVVTKSCDEGAVLVGIPAKNINP
jgi:serine acetyltransferase